MREREGKRERERERKRERVRGGGEELRKQASIRKVGEGEGGDWGKE